MNLDPIPEREDAEPHQCERCGERAYDLIHHYFMGEMCRDCYGADQSFTFGAASAFIFWGTAPEDYHQRQLRRFEDGWRE